MTRRGFTLIELLMVVAVVSMLLALSVSGLRAVREQARAVACAANVRQLLTGLIAYETANERFPPGFEVPDPRGGRTPPNAGAAGFMDPGGWWWFDRIQKFNHLTQDGYKTLTCPSKRLENRWLDVNILCGNYGANLSVFRPTQYLKPYKPFYGVPLSAHQIPRPSETLLVADSGYSLISWWHVTGQPPVELPIPDAASEILPLGSAQHAAYVPGMSLNQEKTVCQGQTLDAVGGRHPHKTVNVGLADGSVAIKRPADGLLVEKIGDEQWDKNPLWQPRPDPAVAVTSTVPTP
jgi:prepilin-type N-terminal cleavage/methylation domain-containing protein/prepilin-type processing-associated H-X9-DG protein